MPQCKFGYIFYFLLTQSYYFSYTCSQLITFCLFFKSNTLCFHLTTDWVDLNLTHYASRIEELYLFCSSTVNKAPSIYGFWHQRHSLNISWGNKCMTSGPFLKYCALPLTLIAFRRDFVFSPSEVAPRPIPSN